MFRLLASRENPPTPKKLLTVTFLEIGAAFGCSEEATEAIVVPSS